ncbi:hypothetical protein Ddc_14714 [Ditylenchus destructor]|nr:hypothetical protein Ddc_14714 [Ditylenchus destructor]
MEQSGVSHPTTLFSTFSFLLLIIGWIQYVSGSTPATSKMFGTDSSPPDSSTPSPSQLRCYTCMSGRISNISRELYPRGLKRGPPYRSSLQTGEPSNPPSYAVHHDDRSVCDDPFSPEDALLEICDTACIKTISRNPHTQIMLRGCLSSIYSQTSAQQQMLDLPAIGQCNETIHENNSIGEVSTLTCLCNTDRCNGSSTPFANHLWALLTIISVFIMLSKYLLDMEFFRLKASKRKHQELSAAAKRAICIYKRDYPLAKLQDIAAVIQQEFGLDALEKTTICEVLSESEKWINSDDSKKPVAPSTLVNSQAVESAIRNRSQSEPTSNWQ